MRRRWLCPQTPDQNNTPSPKKQQKGFLVLPRFASRAETDALGSRAAELVDGFDPATRSVFTTDESQPHAADPYFLQV